MSTTPPTPPGRPPLLALARTYWRHIIGALAVIATSITVTATVIDDDGPNGPKPPRLVVTVHTLNAKGQPVQETTPATTAEAAKAGLEDHDGSRSENPAGVPAAELEAGREQQEDLAARDDLPIVTPDSAPSQPGCTTRLVRNYSSRRGVRPRVFTAHYTVSANRPGWSDVWANAAWFNTLASDASSNYIFDDEGHCAYIVRESDKAWTQAAGNPFSISAEIIATGREGRLTSAAGYARLGQVISDSLKRWDIPVQAGAVSGCTVTRPGIIDHKQWGLCGGGHTDVSPYSVAPIIAAVKAYRATTAGASPARAKVCRQLRFHRAAMKAGKAGQVPQIKKLKTKAAAIGLNETKCRA